MLGKLMKYEWKATWKLLLSANALTFMMTILAWCMVKILDHSGGDFAMMDFTAVMVLFTYAGSMFAVSVGTAIYLIHRFYTSTYGDQGYLLHTLPVDTHHIIVAKILVSTAWVMINILSIYLSVIFLFASSSEVFDSMMRGMKDTIEFLGAQKITIFTVIMTLIAFIFSVFAKVLKVGACISLGQLSSNHKLMLSFAWYVAIYVVERVVYGIYFALQITFYRGLSNTHYTSIFDNQWETSLIAGIISCVVYYLLTWYVMSRKLNLE
ncbi:MAG: hypothetical protein K2O59_02470 [Lachnospiraceae bacterium]|nr:hypothetical protein [Lachnospiraceae bacterium]